MIEVQLNKTNTNPFFGLSNCLRLFGASNSNVISESQLNSAWNEVKDTKEKRELFYSILFSIGDITNRQHNIFKGKKKDSGGNANREAFYMITEWLWNKDKKQFIKFLNAQLFNEYACFDVLFRNRVQTKGSKVLKVYSAFADKEYRKALLDYTYAIINGTNPFNKLLIAKFLTIPRTSKRKGHKKMLPETQKNMNYKLSFLQDLSKMMGWEISYLKGYREWRKQYNGELESVLFTTGKINEFTKEEFIDWFGKLPAQARFRVKNRILYSMKEETVDGGAQNGYKWRKFQPWIKEWETYKENKQQEQRVLEEKVRQGQATDEDKIKLEKVKKEAKVTTGATRFKDIYDGILSGNVDKLKVESFLNTINLPYNSLVIIDDSGSMGGKPFNFAKFLATVCLVKNPDDDARNLIGFFNDCSHWHSFIDKTSSRKNSLLRQQIAQTNSKPLVDPHLSFLDNYKRISQFCDAVYQGGCTDLTSIPRGLEYIVKENPDMLDTLQQYPVWTICSDSDLNNSWSAKSSMEIFQRDCRRILGFIPFVIIIEIPRYGGNPGVNHFEGIENMIYIPGDPAQIEQFLTNFKDMDILDVYSPLQSIYRSDRYQLVRENTL